MLGPELETYRGNKIVMALMIILALGPALLVAILMAELLYVARSAPHPAPLMVQVPPREVAVSLLGPFLLGVELVSLILLSALIGAYHLAYNLGGRQESKKGGIVP